MRCTESGGIVTKETDRELIEVGQLRLKQIANC